MLRVFKIFIILGLPAYETDGKYDPGRTIVLLPLISGEVSSPPKFLLLNVFRCINMSKRIHKYSITNQDESSLSAPIEYLCM